MFSKMAREEGSQDRYLEEMPSCLRALFEQTTSWEQDKRFANKAHSSAKSYRSILAISGLQLPPPLLTEEERAEMREYRREAVKCESKLFDKRREKYSDLILQVMAVMDRVQEQREAKTLIEMQDDMESVRERTFTNGISERADSSRTLRQNNSQSASCEPDYRRNAWDVCSNGRHSNQKSFQEWTENNEDRSRTVNSQLDYLPSSMESMPTTSDESGLLKHQLPRRIDSREQIRSAPLGLEGMDFPLSSTMDKDASEKKRPFSQQSVASNGIFSDMRLDTTQRNKSVSFQQDRKGLEYDSLASASLSVAFSDSSNSTVHSVIEARPQTTAQQQNNRNAGTDDTHFQDYNNHDQQSSTTQSQNCETNTRPVSSKQKAEKQKTQSSRPSQGPSISDQDKTLANLEKLRQKLLEEKQKHLDALKQQELKRLRKQQKEQPVKLDHNYASFHSSTPTRITERPRSSSLPLSRTSDLEQSPNESEHHHVIDRSSPLRRPLSLPPGEMYSILELSGENLDFDTHDHNTEPESSSDKENHVVNEDLSVNRSSDTAGIPRNIITRMNDDQTYTGLSRQKDHKTSAVPRQPHKFFVSNGRDKFAKLSAHAKGFLTRLLMKTEKVRGLIQTIKDTRDVLADISREDTQSMQEKILKENVEGHLKVARCNLHDVFFKIPMKERMSYIAHSRSLARAKQAKRITRSSAGQSKLSAVTLRAIQRRQEGLDHSVRQTEHQDVKLKTEAREERKRKNWNIRVLKPQQGHSSPPLPDRTRSKKQTSRPATAPERPLMQKEDTTPKRPQTTDTVRRNPVRSSRLSLGVGNSNQPAKRSGKKSLGGVQPKMVGALGNTYRTAQPRAQKRLSLPASAQPRIKTSDRPQTANENKRSSRTLAANFAK